MNFTFYRVEMKNYSILFYTGGGSHPDPELRAGEGGSVNFFGPSGLGLV